MDNVPAETDWDELYDPARPTNVEEYLGSEERIREVREWKAVLYAHRQRRTPSYDSEIGSDEEEDRRPMGSTYTSGHRVGQLLIYPDRPVRTSRLSLLRTTTNVAP
jgi:hypothetical protein